MLKKILFLPVFIIASISCLFAQDLETVKSYQPKSYWFTADFDYLIGDKTHLLGQLNFRESFEETELDRGHLMLGASYDMTEYWQVGITERFVYEPYMNYLFSQAFVSHRGKIGSLDFIKTGSIELINHFSEPRGGGVVKDYGRFSALAVLGKDFSLAGLDWRGELSYQLFVHFHPDDDMERETRRIDRTRLKAELFCQLTKGIYLGAFAMRDTFYYFTLGGVRYIQEGDGNLREEPYDAVKRNRITPVYGLSLRFDID